MKKIFISSLAVFVVLCTTLLFFVLFNLERELKFVRIGIQNSILSAPLVLADVNNFFRNNGLKVELVRYDSGKLAFDAFLKDEVDIALAADVPIAISALERNDFSVFTTIVETGKGAWIVARKDMNITRPDDLRGKRIAVQKGTAMHFFLSSLLLYNKIPESEVDFVFLNPSELVPYLLDNRVDAFSARNPYAEEAKNKLGDKIIEFYEPKVYLETINLMAKNGYIKNNQEILRRVLVSLMQAVDFIDKSEATAQQIVARELYNNDLDGAKREWKDFKFTVTLNQSLLLTLEDEARWWIAREEGKKQSTVPNFLDYIYEDLLLEVAPSNVTIIH